MSRAERRKAILDVLCVRRQDTIANLAAEFDVSTRTIKLDIQDLMRSYPIETIRGRYGGGVKVMDWYHPMQRKLNHEQMALLIRLAKGLNQEDCIVLNSIITQFAS